MQINNSVSDKYYTSYKTNTSVKVISGFSLNTDGKVEVQEAKEDWRGFSQMDHTVILDKEKFASVQKQLRPVDDMVKVLKTPIPLAAETFVNKRTNSINLASGASVSVLGGFTLTVTANGVSVSGVGNMDNQKEKQEAQDMAGALSTLLRNAGGTMKNVAHSSAAYDKWTENVTKVMNYFGIDTSKDFTVNGMKYTKDEKGRFVS